MVSQDLEIEPLVSVSEEKESEDGQRCRTNPVKAPSITGVPTHVVLAVAISEEATTYERGLVDLNQRDVFSLFKDQVLVEVLREVLLLPELLSSTSPKETRDGCIPNCCLSSSNQTVFTRS